MLRTTAATSSVPGCDRKIRRRAAATDRTTHIQNTLQGRSCGHELEPVSRIHQTKEMIMERFLYVDSGVGPILILVSKIRSMASASVSKEHQSTSIYMDSVSQKPDITWTAHHSIEEIAQAICSTPPDHPLIRVSKPLPQKFEGDK